MSQRRQHSIPEGGYCVETVICPYIDSEDGRYLCKKYGIFLDETKDILKKIKRCIATEPKQRKTE